MDSSGLVKDGYKAGLWKITPTSVSGTGVTIDSNGDVLLSASPEPYITCFTSDFANYRILGHITSFSGGGAQSLAFRMANGTTPNNTVGDYRDVLQEQGYASATIATAANNGTTFCRFARVEGNSGVFVLDMFSPQSSTRRTSFVSNFQDTTTGGRTSGGLIVTTAYTTWNPRVNGSVTLTGTISIYGYN